MEKIGGQQQKNSKDIFIDHMSRKLMQIVNCNDTVFKTLILRNKRNTIFVSFFSAKTIYNSGMNIAMRKGKFVATNQSQICSDVIIFNVLSNCICVAFHTGKFVTRLQSATFIFTVHGAVV